VLTAAHCLPAFMDANGDGIISVGEGAGNVVVGGPSSAFTGTMSARLVRRHPNGVWGRNTAVDMALVNVNGTFNMETLYSGFYDTSTTLTSRFLKISRHPTTELSGRGGVWAMGLSTGTPQMGLTSVLQGGAFVGWFWTAAGTGASCPGDSGGPSWILTSGPLQPTGWYQIGIHSAGNCGGVSTDLGVAEFRDWVVGTAWAP